MVILYLSMQLQEFLAPTHPAPNHPPTAPPSWLPSPRITFAGEGGDAADIAKGLLIRNSPCFHNPKELHMGTHRKSQALFWILFFFSSQMSSISITHNQEFSILVPTERLSILKTSDQIFVIFIMSIQAICDS